MVIGIGIDIVNVERIHTAVTRHGERFLVRVFTDGERSRCSGRATEFDSLAGRFAVKEAMFKALGRGWDECGGFTSVEVISTEGGPPSVALHGMAASFARTLSVSRIHCSISHDGGMAAAVVILET